MARIKIAIEYDGGWHANSSQWERDRVRLNRIVGADWLVFHVTARHMREGVDGLIGEIKTAVRARQRVLAAA